MRSRQTERLAAVQELGSRLGKVSSCIHRGKYCTWEGILEGPPDEGSRVRGDDYRGVCPVHLANSYLAYSCWPDQGQVKRWASWSYL